MIKFFRRIRQKSIKENNNSLYFKYALGEIVLVVIGILIALQINNWNEETKLETKEVKILEVIGKNLQEDLDDMMINLNIYNTRLKANKEVLKVFKNPSYTNDSLSFWYANIGPNPYFNENTSGYNNLKSIGFQIIQNDLLREQISATYGAEYQWVENLEKDHHDFYFDKLEPFLIKYIQVNETFFAATPRNKSKMSKNYEFSETLKYNIGWLEYIINRYEEMHKKVTLLVQNIDKEVKERKTN